MTNLRDYLAEGAEAEQRGDVGKVAPGQIMELARHNPLLHAALGRFMAGELTYEESLALAVTALIAENQRLIQMNMEL